MSEQSSEPTLNHTSVSDDTFTVNIDSMADSIGGTLQGTFSGTLTDGSDGEVVIENGSFTVERLSDGAVSLQVAFSIDRSADTAGGL